MLEAALVGAVKVVKGAIVVGRFGSWLELVGLGSGERRQRLVAELLRS